MQSYSVVIISGVFGFMAGFIHAKINGSTFVTSILEACVAFFLCSAFAAGLQKYTSFDPQLICGICGVIGLYSKKISERIERLIDVIARRAETKIKNYDSDSDKKSN